MADSDKKTDSPLIEIFKAGQCTDMHGRNYDFSAADIQATADAYDPAVFRAPLVVGHPKTDDPAYGWVSDLGIKDEIVEAAPDQVEPQFAQMVNDGRFSKISASFFPPGSPANPVPGVYYLRHVGFLGAQAPAITGLKTPKLEPSFSAASDDDFITIEFASSDFDTRWAIARFFRNMRDFLIGEHGQQTADSVIPDYLVRDVERASEAELEDESESSFAAPETDSKPNTPSQEQETDMADKDDKDQTADFAAREADLDAREAKLAKEEAKNRLSGFAEFAEKAIDAGKVLPRDKDGMVAFMAALGDDDTVSFAADSGTVTQSPEKWFRGFIDSLPEQVNFAELGADDQDSDVDVSFAAPSGYEVDQESLAIHQKAVAYQTKHGCDYDTAISAVA